IGDTLDPSSLYLHAGPAIHTSGLFTLPMLQAGVAQQMLDHARPERIVETIRDLRVTHLAVVPTVVAALTEVAASQRSHLDSVRMLAYAGAPMQTPQMRAALESLTPHLVQYYGLIEAMPPLSVLTADDHARAVSGRPDLLTSAGRVVASIDLRVDEGRDEICVRGDAVTPGYWNAESRDDLGKAIADGWLETGDLGRVEKGYLWITDRRSDMIISGGYNIFPSEVENAVSTVAGVTRCAAVGLPDSTWGQRLVVGYQTSSGTHVADNALVEACRTLAPHKRPKEFVVLPEVPLGATGKVDRRAVASRLAAAKGAEPSIRQ
ncbi:MAG: AMP-binding protein, partial [Nocardioidaceae bacterium]|nr:AMP-binding protein [Nocardioidaceae bacterium]